jgi:hypothetical protein
MYRSTLAAMAAMSLLASVGCSSAPQDGESTDVASDALCAEPPCRRDPDQPKPKPGAPKGAMASVPAPVVHTQGWDWNGCNFNGYWSSYWGSPTGTYTSGLALNASDTAVNGNYNNGTVSAVPAYDSNGMPVIVGTWNRTIGNSGGPCQSGNFWFRIHGDASGCYLSGLWDYCGTGQSYVWEASQPH